MDSSVTPAPSRPPRKSDFSEGTADRLPVVTRYLPAALAFLLNATRGWRLTRYIRYCHSLRSAGGLLRSERVRAECLVPGSRVDPRYSIIIPVLLSAVTYRLIRKRMAVL
ncbi:hypothetical protein EB105725_31_00510 [Shimwellia blattae DSM 4481 = NBRC 105725]|nr:hypothetical protein EB105725_31_00510 [Shimwellia blattae DSM 4481 = NBRC 105725]